MIFESKWCACGGPVRSGIVKSKATLRTFVRIMKALGDARRLMLLLPWGRMALVVLVSISALLPSCKVDRKSNEAESKTNHKSDEAELELKADLKVLGTAISIYSSKYDYYPVSLQSLQSRFEGDAFFEPELRTILNRRSEIVYLVEEIANRNKNDKPPLQVPFALECKDSNMIILYYRCESKVFVYLVHGTITSMSVEEFERVKLQSIDVIEKTLSLKYGKKFILPTENSIRGKK